MPLPPRPPPQLSLLLPRPPPRRPKPSLVDAIPAPPSHPPPPPAPPPPSPPPPPHALRRRRHPDHLLLPPGARTTLKLVCHKRNHRAKENPATLLPRLFHGTGPHHSRDELSHHHGR